MFQRHIIYDMVTVQGKYLIRSEFNTLEVPYEVIEGIDEYEGKAPCIVVRCLLPDYSLLFGSVRLIVAENGSALSHLATIAREYGAAVFLSCDKITTSIPQTGMLTLEERG